MIGFGLSMRKSGNYSGLGRWLAINTTVGGAKGLLFTILPAYQVGVWSLSALGLIDDDEWDAKNQLAKAHKALKPILGETGANVTIFGLPAFAGVDLSGSTALFHDTYGDTGADVAGTR